VLEKEVAEKLLPIVKNYYFHLSDDEILAMAERFSEIATFLVRVYVKKQQERPGLGNSQEKNN